VAQPPESPYGAPTPAAFASVGGGTSSNRAIETARPDWIVTPPMPKSGFVVQINGTLRPDGTGWRGGNYEGAIGLVTSITVAAAEKNMSSYVSVTLRGDHEGESVDLPHKFIRAVMPTRPGQDVMVIGGPYFAKKATVREIDADVGSCIIELDGIMRPIDPDCLTVFEGKS